MTPWLSNVLSEGPDLLAVLANEFPGLQEVLSKFTNPSKLKMIGMGDKGTAFSDGKVVVKVTEDPREAAASANIVGLDIPGVNKIYHVGEFAREVPYKDVHDDEPIPTKYYLIVQDLLTTNLSTREKEIIDLLGKFLSDNKISYPFDVTKMANAVYNYGYMKDHKMYKSPTADAILSRLLGTMLQLYAKRTIELGDVSSQNVGKDVNGNLKIFDLGLSSSPKIGLPVVEWTEEDLAELCLMSFPSPI